MNKASLFFSGLALFISIIALGFSYAANDISMKALETDGPNIAIANQSGAIQQVGKYFFTFPLKNVGSRNASDLKVNFSFVGVDNNVFYILHQEQEQFNVLSPGVTRVANADLEINLEPKYVSIQLQYSDALISKIIVQTFYYQIDFSSKEHPISVLLDRNVKDIIDTALNKN